jgi:hypothetical protein
MRKLRHLRLAVRTVHSFSSGTAQPNTPAALAVFQFDFDQLREFCLHDYFRLYEKMMWNEWEPPNNNKALARSVGYLTGTGLVFLTMTCLSI